MSQASARFRVSILGQTASTLPMSTARAPEAAEILISSRETKFWKPSKDRVLGKRPRSGMSWHIATCFRYWRDLSIWSSLVFETISFTLWLNWSMNLTTCQRISTYKGDKQPTWKNWGREPQLTCIWYNQECLSSNAQPSHAYSTESRHYSYLDEFQDESWIVALAAEALVSNPRDRGKIVDVVVLSVRHIAET